MWSSKYYNDLGECCDCLGPNIALYITETFIYFPKDLLALR